jgi:hypothetical protein
MQDNQIINKDKKNNYNFQNKKNNTSVEYKYICIKKDVFDSAMINLNYLNLKDKKVIEIIYKSPSVYLEGLYFKTPPISSKDIIIYYKENKHNYLNNKSLSPTIKLLLNYQEHTQFINILISIDETISRYINKNAIEIEDNLNKYHNDNRTMSSFNYEQIIKFRYNNIIELHMKSYIDKQIIDTLENNSNNNSNLNNKYIFTFNVSNIYFSNNNNLLPLVKCNKCELVL